MICSKLKKNIIDIKRCFFITNAIHQKCCQISQKLLNYFVFYQYLPHN